MIHTQQFKEMTMKYEITAYMRSTVYDKVCLVTEADSAAEALQFAKENPDMCEQIHIRTDDVCDGEYIDMDEWSVRSTR